MSQVVCDHVSKVFRNPRKELVRAVDDLSLTIQRGELLVLVGPSGSGKTTTLRLVAGLDEVTSGRITFDGQGVNGVAAGDRDVAMVFQHGALHPQLTVYENMALSLTLRRHRAAEIDQRVRAAAEILGLVPLLGRLPNALSGGQRQRAAVGRAIVRQPRVFLFDEPLSNLDAAMRRQLRHELKRLQARLGTTALYVTHDQAEAMALGQRLAVLREGVLQQVGEPGGVYSHPANLFVAGFIGSPPMNLLRGVVGVNGDDVRFEPMGETSRVSGGGWRVAASDRSALRLHAGRAVVLGLRPEFVRPCGQGEHPAEGVSISLPVDLVEPLGAEAFVHGSANGVPLTARWPSGSLPSPGQVVPVRLDLGGARYFDAVSEQAIG